MEQRGLRMILPPGRNEVRGFTLIELVVVALILSLTLLFAWPDLVRVYEDESLRTASRGIASTLSYAHQRAIIEGLNLRVNFDLDEGRYWLSLEENRGASPGFYRRIQSSFLHQMSLPRGVRIKDITTLRGKVTSGVEYISFSMLGTIDTFIHLVGGKGKIWTIRLKRTGRVRIYEGE